MNKPQSSSPRARLQALQAIPERQRTEEEWDELNELEIMFAAGNRDTGSRDRGMPGGPERGNSAAPHDRGPPREAGQERWRDGNPQQQPQGQRKPGDGGGPGGGGRNKGPRKFHKKPPKNNPPR
jgi:hypothetical protein